MKITPMRVRLSYSYGRLLCLFILLPVFQACGVMYPNRILDAKKDYQYTAFLDSIPQDFTFAAGDMFELFVFPEKGYNLIESQIIFSEPVRQNTSVYSLAYGISQNGDVFIPMIGSIQLAGMTEREAEELLTGLYANNYTDPFVNVNLITPKTVMVYRGSSDAKQVVLTRPNMTLLEVIAAAGGVPQDARPSHIKVIRQEKNQTLVESVNLKKIEGINRGDNYIRPNDIVYIEPGINTQFFQEIAPVISAVTGIVIIYAYFTNINSQ
jgi:polysaccharide export outer membrane protein